ncbi:aromatic amino acid exporter YddG [Sorangium sp. So ce1078]|uniref:aromatic amino acid exporter YddG n=1 Tax=Sorangium sp. So ce1078 TaxID=3133329 RepID=UPI003F5E8A61
MSDTTSPATSDAAPRAVPDAAPRAVPDAAPRAVPGATSSTRPSRRAATLAGVAAIGLWGSFALLSTSVSSLPPLQVLASTFAIAALLGAAQLARRGRGGLAALRQPLGAWIVGVGGLFGYHALYFYALTAAPPVQVSVISYLWPLLIVLLSAALPGGRLRLRHLVGALLGLAGVWTVLAAGGAVRPSAAHAIGYLAALGCALTWSTYSVLQRRFAEVPADAVAGPCAATAALGLAGHLAFERTVVPTAGQALGLLALGLGPVGVAFFAWDHATKHGDVPQLGALSYGAPVLSTLLLCLAGHAEASPQLLAACALVTAGGLVATASSRPARGAS